MKATLVRTSEDFKKVIDLRKSILHPKGPFSRIQYPLDHDQGSVHLAIFNDIREILACGTILMEDEQENPSKKIARIRGMAVSKKSQGMGLGTIVLNDLIKESEKQKIEKIWCNARTENLNFYLKRDFISIGDEFVTPSGIPHFKLIKTIVYKDSVQR